MDAVVKIHLNAFQGFFLTNLGPKFLKLYYQSVASVEEGILLGAYNKDELVGFCAACLKSKGFNSLLIKKNFFSFCKIGLSILITKPLSLIRVYKNLSKTGNQEDDGDYAEVLSIGVDRSAQNLGAGKLLISELEDILRKKSIGALSLTTDAENNKKTLNFYSKRGFKEMYRFNAYPNRWMFRLIKDLR